jgi:hypothetical protein
LARPYPARTFTSPETLSYRSAIGIDPGRAQRLCKHAHVSLGLPIIPYGRISQVRLAVMAFFTVQPSQRRRNLSARSHTPLSSLVCRTDLDTSCLFGIIMSRCVRAAMYRESLRTLGVLPRKWLRSLPQPKPALPDSLRYYELMCQTKILCCPVRRVNGRS